MGGSIILGSTFGIDVQGKDDPYITIAEKALHSLALAGNAGSHMGMCLIIIYILFANLIVNS